MSSDDELLRRAEQLRVQSTELLLRNCLAGSEDAASTDVRVLEIAVLEARQLNGVDADLLSEAEDRLEEAQALKENLSREEKPAVLLERLFDAVNDGDCAAAKACLDANAGTSRQLPIDVTDHESNTPLSEAACYGEVELMSMFLSRGAHPDAQNDLGRTPLWRACYNGHTAAVRLLLESGADKSIASNLGEEAGKYGTPESKALVASWDSAQTLETRKRLCLEVWTRQDHKRDGPSKPPRDASNDAPQLEDVLRSGQEPCWPITIGMRQLQLALVSAHNFGKVPLVVCNHLEQVERFLLYSCEGLIDAKEVLGEVYIKKSKTLEEARESLKTALLSTMETHGVGLGLHLRMSDTACDFKGTFCAAGVFPLEVFGGSGRWNSDEVKRHFPDPAICLQPDFHLVVSTEYSLDEAMEHLADKLPYFEDMAVIDIDPESVL